MAFVASEDFRAAAETKPTIRFAIVVAAALARELLAADDAELFLGLMEKRTRLLVEKTIQNRVLGYAFTLLRDGAAFTLADALTKRNLRSGILKACR